MLPPAHRLRDGAGFASAIRRGRRAGARELVLHHARGPEPLVVGFAVSRAVGNAVVRNRVKRRLRHLVAERLRGGTLPVGGTLVVRALPPAAEADSRRLGAALDRGLARLVAEEVR